MPGGDRTGPLGLGPMTGRSAGYCAGFNDPGYASERGQGGFCRSGRGSRFRGRGWSCQFNPVTNRKVLETRMNMLRQEMDYIQTQLDRQKGDNS